MTGRGLGLMLAIVLAAGSFPAAGAADSSSAWLQGFRCREASRPAQRMIEITAAMRPLPGTARMKLRFVLLERPFGSHGFHQVHGGDLGRWRHPNPASFGQSPDDIWMVNKPVSNLAASTVYRFRVTFRWIGASKQVIGVENLVSSSCVQGGGSWGQG